MTKKTFKLPNEPKFKGRPTRASFKKIKEEREKALIKLEKDAAREIQTTREEKFLVEFLKCGGNATEAAMRVFNCKSRRVASSVGSEYLKRIKPLARLYMESKGASYGGMLDTAIKKMKRSKTTDWWDRLMKLAGYEDFISKQKSGIAVSIISAHRDTVKDYVTVIEGEEVAGDDSKD